MSQGVKPDPGKGPPAQELKAANPEEKETKPGVKEFKPGVQENRSKVKTPSAGELSRGQKEKEAFQRGLKELEQNRYELAIESFDQALKENPKSAESFYHRAKAHFQLSDTDRSIEDINQSIKINPKKGDYYFF